MKSHKHDIRHLAYFDHTIPEITSGVDPPQGTDLFQIRLLLRDEHIIQRRRIIENIVQ